MITGGNATIFVSDMDRAVTFYTDILGLALEYRAGNHWAQVMTTSGLRLGLHPQSPNGPKPGSRGAISVGFDVKQPLEGLVGDLTAKGVRFEGPIKEDKAVRLAHFADPDGNELYLCESKW